MTGLQLIGTGRALPERCVTNDELSLTVDTSDAWISERTGIGVPELSAILLRLELQGFAASPMNGYYRKR